MARNEQRDLEKGFSIMEVLVGLVLTAIMALGITRSNKLSMQIREKTIRDSAATQIVVETLEDFSSKDPSTLSDDDDLSDVQARNGVDFNRTIDVTENGDGSRTVDVTVTGNIPKLGGNASLSLNLLPWGSG